MNKKILSLLIAGAAILSTTSVFAEDEYATMLISDDLLTQEATTETMVSHSSFIKLEAQITEIGEESISATMGEEEIIINKNMLQMSIDASGEMIELANGDNVTLFVREDTPMVLSLPAQYSPSVIVKTTDDDTCMIDVDTYTKTEDGSYINNSQQLVLNVSEETQIIKLSREMFDGNLDGCDLVVVYNMATFSIPAQTSPLKVIVLNKATQEMTADETFTKIVAGDKEFEYTEVEGAEGMVPVRAIAEALGFTVDWDGELRSVMLNSGKFSFTIDEDLYTKGKMMPVSLGQAPVCVAVGDTGITHVPVTFFSEILGLNINIENSTLNITLN